MVIAASAHAAFHKAAHYFGVPARKVPVDADWKADVDAMAALVDDEHRARRRLGAAVSARRDRSDPRAGRTRRIGRRVDARRCVHGRLRTAVHGDERHRAAAVGLPRRRRHDDLGRHPQARLRAEGRVGARAPHQGAPPLPDLRVRRLARRLLRVTQHAGHAARAADGDGLGGDAPSRHRRLPAAHGGDHRDCKPHARGRARDRRPAGARAHRTRTFSPSPPMPDSRTRSTRSRSETRCSNAVGSTTARPRPTRCT